MFEGNIWEMERCCSQKHEPDKFNMHITFPRALLTSLLCTLKPLTITISPGFCMCESDSLEPLCTYLCMASTKEVAHNLRPYLKCATNLLCGIKERALETNRAEHNSPCCNGKREMIDAKCFFLLQCCCLEHCHN